MLTTETGCVAQTISFGTIGSHLYGDHVPLSATASSGLSVTFSVISGPASLAGSTLTMTGVGTVIVAATQAGNSAYAAATPVNETIVVNPAPLTITANNQTKVYGAALPSLTYTAAGFVNGDTSASLATQPAVTTSVTAASPLGTYSITASGAVDADYTISYVNGTLTVTRNPNSVAPVVNVVDTSGSFNGARFPGTATVNDQASLEGVSPTLAYYAGNLTAQQIASATPLAYIPSNAGTYTVVASFAGSGDYLSAQSEPVSFTIGRATPGLSVSDASQPYTGLGFTSTITLVGVNGAATSLEGATPTLAYYAGSKVTRTALAAAPIKIGTYTVVASFAGSTTMRRCKRAGHLHDRQSHARHQRCRRRRDV